MGSSFVEFFTFQLPNTKYVVLGVILLSISSAIVGCFTFVRKKSLIGDVISHAVLPGICISFMLTGTKNPFILILGAFVTGWLAVFFMDKIIKNTKIKEDTATGLSLSVFFGIGILLMTFIQSSGNANQSGLDAFLFGKAATLLLDDLIAFGAVAILVLLIIFLFFKEFTLISFDKQFAKAIGLPIEKLEMLLTIVTVLVVVTGIQAVGVVLMSAMLVTPAAAARFWTNRIKMMLPLAACFSVFSGISGAFISYTTPKMPTGPWIVMILSIIALLTFFFSPKKGIIFKLIRRRQIRKQLLEENILKEMYKVSENQSDSLAFEIQNSELLKRFGKKQLNKGITQLLRNRYIKKGNNGWVFRKEGFKKGKRITRLHRLWELYLTEYLRIAPDHVHEDAETIEHVITPELEEKLEKLLNYPTKDPHSSIIPSKNNNL